MIAPIFLTAPETSPVADIDSIAEQAGETPIFTPPTSPAVDDGIQRSPVAKVEEHSERLKAPTIVVTPLPGSTPLESVASDTKPDHGIRPVADRCRRLRATSQQAAPLRPVGLSK